MSVSKILWQRKKELRMGYAELSMASGVPESTIKKVLLGTTPTPQLETVKAISRALGISLDDLDEEISAPTIPTYPGIIPIRKKRVPLLGTIAAGEPIYANQEYDAYVACDDDVRCDFALRVTGQSMMPYLHEGDIVFIQQQADVDDGQIAALLIDDSATLKHLCHLPDGIQLTADNPSVYSPHVYRGAECNSIRVLGRAVAFQRKM